jgi:hypothetical protein
LLLSHGEEARMYGCDLVFTPETAEQVRTELRKQFGGTCPCDTGQACPLLPADLDLTNLTPCRSERRASA